MFDHLNYSFHYDFFSIHLAAIASVSHTLPKMQCEFEAQIYLFIYLFLFHQLLVGAHIEFSQNAC